MLACDYNLPTMTRNSDQFPKQTLALSNRKYLASGICQQHTHLFFSHRRYSNISNVYKTDSPKNSKR